MYNANKHATYSERCERWSRAFQGVLEEGARLRNLRQFEADGGTHVDYTDTDIATKSEHESLSTLMDQFIRWEAGDTSVPFSNKRSLWTPFVQ